MDHRRVAIALGAASLGLALASCGAHTIVADGDAEADTGWDVGADDGADDGDESAAACPDDMVAARGVCVDRYEASAGPSGETLSVEGAEPWSSATFAEAQAACEAAGKRLCTPEEWLGACAGAAGQVYPYGDAYAPHACNGFDHGAGVAVATGSMVECEGGYPGLFDMSGNLWEWVSSCEFGLCRVRGGSFNRQEVGTRCSADLGFDPEERYGAIGFRCCRDL